MVTDEENKALIKLQEELKSADNSLNSAARTNSQAKLAALQAEISFHHANSAVTMDILQKRIKMYQDIQGDLAQGILDGSGSQSSVIANLTSAFAGKIAIEKFLAPEFNDGEKFTRGQTTSSESMPNGMNPKPAAPGI